MTSGSAVVACKESPTGKHLWRWEECDMGHEHKVCDHCEASE